MYVSPLILGNSLSLGLLQLSHHEGLAECATQGKGASSLHVSPDLCVDSSQAWGCSCFWKTSWALRNHCQNSLLLSSPACARRDLWGCDGQHARWAGGSDPTSHSLPPKTLPPSSQLSSSLASLSTHLGTEDQQGTWNPLPPSLPTCHLPTRGKGLRAASQGPSVLHLAGGLARRGAHRKLLPEASHPALLLQQMGNEESVRSGSTTS